MNTNRKVTSALIIIIAILLLGMFWQAKQLAHLREVYDAREYTRSTYDAENYHVAGELYAVKPDGTEIVQDTNGRLWEIPGLKVTRFNKLLLEVRNGNTISNVWIFEYTPTDARLSDYN